MDFSTAPSFALALAYFAPSHYTAVLLFALFTAIVFGITQRETPQRMIRYGVFCFLGFAVSAIVISWLMFLIAH